MSEQEVRRIREEHQVNIVSGNNVPRPIRRFEEAPFPPHLTKSLYDAGFQAPTAIQVQGWPIALSGKDMVGIADTGSGKTVAFLLPGIVHIQAQPALNRGEGPIMLVTVQVLLVTTKSKESSGLKTLSER